MIIPEPRTFYCIKNEAGVDPKTGQAKKWRLQFLPLIARPGENPNPVVIVTSNEPLGRGVKIGNNYVIWDTDEGGGVTKRHIEPAEKKIVSFPSKLERAV